MRELFQGEPPTQYKEGVEEYIRHHSGERAIADELILKTISRVFNLNVMIISVQGSTCTETIIAEHRQLLTTENSCFFQTNFWQQVGWIMLNWKPGWTKGKVMLISNSTITQYSRNNMGRNRNYKRSRLWVSLIVCEWVCAWVSEWVSVYVSVRLIH